MAMQRPSWKNRGKNFSDLGVMLECGKRDLTTVKNVLHYVTTGSAKFMFNVGKELFFVPVVMVLKVNTNIFFGGKFKISIIQLLSPWRSDAAIYERLVAGTDEDDHYYRGCLRNMLAEPAQEGLFTGEQVIPKS